MRTQIVFRTTIAIALAALVLGSCENTSFYSVLGNKAQIQPLAISPSSTTVSSNGTIQFSASGGVPPYTFSILSGVGSINSSSGLYTAPATPGTTYVLVTDKQGSTAKATVTNVDYNVTALNDTSTSHVAGSAISGNFTMKNVGTANGGQNVSWAIYLSTSPTLGAGGTVIDANTTTPLNAGASSSPISFAGTWPNTPGTYYLIATVSAPDGLTEPNNSLASLAITISAAQVDYIATSIACTSGAVLSGGPLTGSFQITNNGPNNGTQYVNWQVYASTSNTLTTGTPVLVAAGSTPNLNAGVSSPVINFSGQWPLTYGNYYLIVKLTVPVDINTVSAGNPLATSTTTPVGFINEASYESTTPSNNAVPGASVGITLQPGMSLSVTGTMAATPGDTDDYLQFNTGTANTITFSMSWTTTAANMYLEVDTTAGVLVSGVTNLTSASNSLSLSWPTAGYSPNVQMTVDSKDAGVTNAGAYTMIISAN